jgi:endonuclease/exonuclease/phosphatase family metal-dependent hydrolase
MSRFRVATYNVHKCKGVDWRVSPQRISDVICELNADIIAVQEVLSSQAEAISTRVQVPFTFGRARHHQNEPYGNAVFTLFPVSSSESYDLTVRVRERRQCVRVSVALTDGNPLHFFAVHLGTSFLERRAQARRFVSEDILDRPEVKGARIVAGDFNEWTRGLATQLLSRHLESADIMMHLKRRTTYPGVLPFMHLDHIYYDHAFRLREMHLHRTRLALLASDHLPLIADFDTVAIGMFEADDQHSARV